MTIAKQDPQLAPMIEKMKMDSNYLPVSLWVYPKGKIRQESAFFMTNSNSTTPLKRPATYIAYSGGSSYQMTITLDFYSFGGVVDL